MDHLIEYLEYKLARTGMIHEVPKCQAGLVTVSKPEGNSNG